MIESRSPTASTAETSPPSEGSTISAPGAPANTTVGTMGNLIPNPLSISAALGAMTVAPSANPNTGTPSAVSAPADIPARTTTDQATERYPEASTWAALAKEDVENALKRLAMAAKDEHENDPTKSVQQYYSESLSKIIKDAEIEFDVGCMDSAGETERNGQDSDNST
ncbi:hypothetical protein PRZ48_010926 [Zasmidium cellare]|uniref:Uncharacterized protein n=1 Tax=Zasmidium cellare TaxID=395010 RepID=A0ABR0EAW9_ZASCE|nr:hypothetical protein PRZ48_010926 [Zasmidium cellare]